MEIISEGHPAFLHMTDVDDFRAYVRDHRPRGLVNKLMDEHEAIGKFVCDGDYINIENNMFQRGPSSLVRELIRQKKKRLGFCGKFNYVDIALLAAAGIIDRLDVGFIGVGLVSITEALNQDKLKLTEWSNAGLTLRLMAGAMGIPFIPVRFLGGTGCYEYSGAKLAKDPFTNKEVVLLPSLNPDVALIHANQCDIYGNARIIGCGTSPVESAGASKKVIISTEEIIDTEEIRRNPDRTTIPCYMVDAVVHAPYGAYPGEVPGWYSADSEQVTKIYQATSNKDGSALKNYLQENIYEIKSHEEFLEKRVGTAKLLALKNQMRIQEGYHG